MTLVSELSAIATQAIESDYPDALAKANYLWSVLSDSQAEYRDGGTYFQQPIKLLANSSQGFNSGSTDVIDLNLSQQLQYMTFNYKFFNTNVSFSLEELTKLQDSKYAVTNFMQAKIKGALADTIRDLTTALHGTSVSNTKSFDGLKDVVAASGTAYGGLTDTDFASGAFLPVIETTTAPTYVNFNKGIMKIVARAQQDGSYYSTKVDTGLMNAATYSAFLASEQQKQRFQDVNKLESGFEGVRLNGINIFLDNFVPGTQDGSTGDNYAYFFPKDIFKMCYKYGLKGKNSPMDGEIRIPNQPIVSNQKWFAGNLICENRRLVAVWKTLVA